MNNFSISKSMQLFRYFLLLTIISWVSNGYCQSSIIDSLNQEIKDYQLSGDNDTNYSKLQFDLAWEYEQIEQLEPAIQHALIALKSTGNNPYLQFEIHNSLGNLYMTNENYVKSIEEFQLALESATLTGDPNNVGIVHYNLSTHYYYTANDSLSYLHLNKAYKLMKDSGDTAQTINLLNSIGAFDIKDKNLKEASTHYSSALELSLSINDSSLISNSYNNSANYYLIVKDTITALNYFKKSFEIDRLNGTVDNKAIVTYNIANIYEQINQTDSALFYIEKSKEYALKNNRFTLLEPIYDLLFRIQYKENNYTTLPGIFYNYQLTLDSLLTKGNVQQYTKAENKIELILAQQENELLQFNKQTSEQRLFYLSIVTLLLSIVLIVALITSKRFKIQKEIAESLHQESKDQKLKIEFQQKELIEQNLTLEKNALYKDRIMSLLAHDLRTPFASINSLNHLVKATGHLNEKQTKFINTSDQVVSGGLDLISDILHIYKLENITELELELLNISQLLNSSANKMEAITTVKSQKINLDFQDDIEFCVNREMLQSAVDNLLSNASKYSDPNTTITIKMQKKAKTLTIEIIDEGSGFSLEEQKIIFDRFNKFTRKKLQDESSTGLGLFLVKGFVEKMGGTISIASKPNEGSNFTLIFNQQ